jgi:hypothetical protein
MMISQNNIFSTGAASRLRRHLARARWPSAQLRAVKVFVASATRRPLLAKNIVLLCSLINSQNDHVPTS